MNPLLDIDTTTENQFCSSMVEIFNLPVVTTERKQRCKLCRHKSIKSEFKKCKVCKRLHMKIVSLCRNCQNGHSVTYTHKFESAN